MMRWYDDEEDVETLVISPAENEEFDREFFEEN